MQTTRRLPRHLGFRRPLSKRSPRDTVSRSTVPGAVSPPRFRTWTVKVALRPSLTDLGPRAESTRSGGAGGGGGDGGGGGGGGIGGPEPQSGSPSAATTARAEPSTLITAMPDSTGKTNLVPSG